MTSVQSETRTLAFAAASRWGHGDFGTSVMTYLWTSRTVFCNI